MNLYNNSLFGTKKSETNTFPTTYEKSLNANLSSFPDPEATAPNHHETPHHQTTTQQKAKRNKNVAVAFVLIFIAALIAGCGVFAHHLAKNQPANNAQFLMGNSTSSGLAVADPIMLTNGETLTTANGGAMVLISTITATETQVLTTIAVQTVVVQVTATATEAHTAPEPTTLVSIVLSPSGTIATSGPALASLDTPFTFAPETTEAASTTPVVSTATPTATLDFCGAPGGSCNF